jgi:phosphatidylinositol-3-phosphatase
MGPGMRRARSIQRIGAVAVALGLLAGQVASVHAQGGASPPPAGGHVFLVMMENTGYDSLMGDPGAPWINAAAASYGLATNAYGVAHPSQPNYIAITSGSTQGVTSDGNVDLDVQNLVDQLESHGRTWTDYQQSLDRCGGDKLATSCGDRWRKHDPFVSYVDVQSDPARMARVVDLDRLDADLARGSVADFSFIAPDQCHDMHGHPHAAPSDPCASDSPGLIATGDAFLEDLVGRITGSTAWTGDSVIFITWDESEPTAHADTSGCCGAVPGGGHVVSLVISRLASTPRRSDVAYNHYSILATIEDRWGLGCLGSTCDVAQVTPMTDLVGAAS